jgi:hypothetical protein
MVFDPGTSTMSTHICFTDCTLKERDLLSWNIYHKEAFALALGNLAWSAYWNWVPMICRNSNTIQDTKREHIMHRRTKLWKKM